MKYKHALIALAAMALVVLGGVVVPKAWAATTNASCTASPVVSDTGTGQRITVVCTVPKPPPVTVTATATATVTVTPDPSPTQDASSTPTPDPTPTVTPTPTPTPTPAPQTGYPDASNTGVPAGTVLSAYTGPCTITAAGTVIDSKTVGCPLDIQAANVTIRNSKVTGRIKIDTDVNQSWSLTLTDSDVDGGAQGDEAAIGNGNVNIVRANIHGSFNSLRCEEHSHSCNISDSYIHAQYLPPTGANHEAGIGIFGGLTPCTGPDANGVPACFSAVHNTIWCEPLPNGADGGCTADLAMLVQMGPLHGALVQGNLFHASPGSAYCLYGGVGPKPSDHIVIRDNVFERGANRQCAAYGPVTTFDSNGTGNVWTNNTWDDGTTVAPAN